MILIEQAWYVVFELYGVHLPLRIFVVCVCVKAKSDFCSMTSTHTLHHTSDNLSPRIIPRLSVCVACQLKLQRAKRLTFFKTAPPPCRQILNDGTGYVTPCPKLQARKTWGTLLQ